MTQYQMNLIQSKFTEIYAIESNAAGLYYLFDDRKKEIAICGEKGKTLLNKSQVLSLINELNEILSVHFGWDLPK